MGHRWQGSMKSATKSRDQAAAEREHGLEELLEGDGGLVHKATPPHATVWRDFLSKKIISENEKCKQSRRTQAQTRYWPHYLGPRDDSKCNAANKAGGLESKGDLMI